MDMFIQYMTLEFQDVNLFYHRSEITPCNKIDKPLVVYRLALNVMTSIA